MLLCLMKSVVNTLCMYERTPQCAHTPRTRIRDGSTISSRSRVLVYEACGEAANTLPGTSRRRTISPFSICIAKYRIYRREGQTLPLPICTQINSVSQARKCNYRLTAVDKTSTVYRPQCTAVDAVSREDSTVVALLFFPCRRRFCYRKNR